MSSHVSHTEQQKLIACRSWGFFESAGIKIKWRHLCLQGCGEAWSRHAENSELPDIREEILNRIHDYSLRSKVLDRFLHYSCSKILDRIFTSLKFHFTSTFIHLVDGITPRFDVNSLLMSFIGVLLTRLRSIFFVSKYIPTCNVASHRTSPAVNHLSHRRTHANYICPSPTRDTASRTEEEG